MYDSPTSMDFDSEFSPQSIYDDRDSLNNSFGGRNRQLSTNIRYMEEEEDEINRSHNRRNNNNYNNSNSNRSVNLGGAYVENERRANAVKDYLMTYGISGSRLSVISYGKERPVNSGSSPLAWSQNRRSVTVKAN